MTKPDAAAILRGNLAGLRLAQAALERAWRSAPTVGAGPVFAEAEQDQIEVLSGRFARTTDYLINKVLRSLDRYELAADGTLLDLINRAERRGIVASARELRRMKELRNEIVHEYLPAGQAELLVDLRTLVPAWLEAVARTLQLAAEIPDRKA